MQFFKSVKDKSIILHAFNGSWSFFVCVSLNVSVDFIFLFFFQSVARKKVARVQLSVGETLVCTLLRVIVLLSDLLLWIRNLFHWLVLLCHLPTSPQSPKTPLPGQDQRAEPQQCGGSLLHPDWWPGPGHAGGASGVLLQVADRVAPNEGVHCAGCCRHSCSGLSLLNLRQWC